MTLVGETTAGAGHLADFRALPGGFALQLSTGRTYDPITGEGWEATGVEPDVEVESRLALERALEHLEGS